jgi:hypothetical protein
MILFIYFLHYRKAKLPKSLIFDRRILPQSLSTDEKLKHQYFAQRYHDEVIKQSKQNFFKSIFLHIASSKKYS